MINSDLILVIFRIINAVILFAIFVQAFRYYFYPVIRNQILEKLQKIKQLKEEITRAQGGKILLDQAMESKKSEAELLLEKVKKWRLSVEKEREKNAYECAMQAQIMQAMRREQEEQYAKSLVQRKLGPLVLAETQRLLMQEYMRDEHKARQFNEYVFQTIMAEVIRS